MEYECTYVIKERKIKAFCCLLLCAYYYRPSLLDNTTA